MTHAHQELERKFIVAANDGYQRLCTALSRIEGLDQAAPQKITTSDLYLVLAERLPFIYRYRCDAALKQLTAKSLVDSFPLRTEITIELPPALDQQSQVEAMFTSLGLSWSGQVNKDVYAWQHDGCEFVYYRAQHADTHLECIELEAKTYTSVEQGLQKIRHYAELLQLNSYCRESQRSLFYHLVYPALPLHLQQRCPPIPPAALTQ